MFKSLIEFGAEDFPIAALSLDDIVNVALRLTRAECAIVRSDSVSGPRAIASTAADACPDGRLPSADCVDPLVALKAGFGFYVGLPVRDGVNGKIGTLAVLAASPRTITEEELKLLGQLAMSAGCTLQ